MIFIHYDYIGAPFSKNRNDTPNLVGNGGFSLRTKSIMIKILTAISPISTVYNSSTLEYIQENDLSFPPEDIYYSKRTRVRNWSYC